LRTQAQRLETRLPKDRELGETEKGVFYSNWIYSAVRNLTALETYNSIQAIADYLKLPRSQVKQVVEFLLETGLCVPTPKGFRSGPKRTHVGASSPFVSRHHQNWRLKGFGQMDLKREDDLFYTGPMSLSRELEAKIRNDLLAFIEKMNKQIHPSRSEVVRCLNIDWFQY